MSTLSSASTPDEVQDAYLDNASYAEDGSVAKAKAFVTACTMLLLLIPKMAKQSFRHEIQTNIDLIYEQMQGAQRFVANKGRGRIRHVDFRNFRD